MSRKISLLLVTALFLTFSSSCTAQDEPPLFGKLITVGVMSDMPGVSELREGKYRGFDIEFAEWLGNELNADINYVHINVGQREGWLEQGKVDLVIAAYSMTDDRADLVDFAGPYMYDKQGFLNRISDPLIISQDQIANKSVCTLEDSTSEEQLRNWLAILNTETVVKKCVDDLLQKRFQLVSTDSLILSGYAKQLKDKVHLSGFTFGHQERYGVGMKKNSYERCQLITDKINQFIRSGKWGDFFRNNFEGLEPNDHKPISGDVRQCKQTSTAP